MQNIRHPLHFCIFCAIYRFVMKQKSTWQSCHFQLQFSRCFLRSNGNSSSIVCNIQYNSASGIKKIIFAHLSFIKLYYMIDKIGSGPSECVTITFKA